MLHNLSSFHLQLFLIIHKYKFPVPFFTLSINIFNYNKCGNKIVLKGIVNYGYIFRFELFVNLVSMFPRNTVILVFAADNCGTTLGSEALYLYPSIHMDHYRFSGFALPMRPSLRRTVSGAEKVVWSFMDPSKSRQRQSCFVCC